jgi:hypothetical protein
LRKQVRPSDPGCAIAVAGRCFDAGRRRPEPASGSELARDRSLGYPIPLGEGRSDVAGRWTLVAHAIAPLTGLPLPSGFRAIPGVAGPGNGQDQHGIGIGISGQRGDLVIVVSFNGGKDLAWADVTAIWSRAYTHLAATLLKA